MFARRLLLFLSDYYMIRMIRKGSRVTAQIFRRRSIRQNTIEFRVYLSQTLCIYSQALMQCVTQRPRKNSSM